MGLLASLMGASTGGYGPTADWWYQPVAGGGRSAAGVNVGQDTALSIAAVYACVRLLANGVATLPLPLYERLANGGKQRAYQHPLYDVVVVRPNRRMSSGEFRRFGMVNLLLKGNFYCQITPGPRGPVDQLVPLENSYMTVEEVDDGNDVRYIYRKPGQQQRVYSSDEIWHLKGLSLDGLCGMSVIQYARESFGLTLATESYGARFFSQDARPRGVLKTSGKLSKEGHANLSRTWADAQSGLGNAHKVAILEEGLEWQQVSLNAEDSQLLATRDFQAADVARWFGVPLHLIQSHTKDTSWGSGLEQQDLGFIIYSLLPWLRIWEDAINGSLVVASQKYFAEFLIDAQNRADLKTRYEVYSQGRQNGILSINDVHRLENLNPVEVVGADDYHVQVNMVPVDQLRTQLAQKAAQPNPMQAVAQAAPPVGAVRGFVEDAAARVVHKEQAVLLKAYKRTGNDPGAWLAAVHEFYADHASYVTEQMRFSVEVSTAYCERQHQRMMVSVLRQEEWDASQQELVELAMAELEKVN